VLCQKTSILGVVKNEDGILYEMKNVAIPINRPSGLSELNQMNVMSSMCRKKISSPNSNSA
jgi:hypothetical protein